VAKAPGSGTPTGTVTVSDGTQSCNGSVAAGSCSITFSSAGARSVTASYPGDGNFASSTSGGVGQTVNTAPTTTTITSDTPDPSVAGEAFPVNFSVSSSSGTPTGTVTVTVSDGTASCTGSVAAGTCSLTLTAAGTHTLTATYAGDANFSTSTSAGESHTVSPAAASKLVFTVQPSDVTVGNTMSPVVVTAFDMFNNTATGFTGDVVIAIGNDASGVLGPATLGGTLTVAATLGVATFGDLTIDKPGVGYTLVVNATGLTGATSNGFTVIGLGP